MELDFRTRQKAAPYLFLLPNMLVFGIFIVTPAFFGLYVSFTEWNVLTEPEFTGLTNFIEIIGSANFWTTTGKTFIYVFGVVPLTVALSLFLAVLLDKEVKGRSLFRALFYVPTILSFIVIGVTWRWIFGGNFGVANYVLELLGFSAIDWLTNSTTATVMVILATIWARTGYFFVMFLAGLQGIPSVYYEAADIDGTTNFQKFRFITLPLLKPVALVVVVLDTIEAFKMFGLIKVMTEGGPGDATTYMVQEIYLTAFETGDMGYASAMSVMLFLILGILTFTQFQISRRGVNAYE